MLVPGVKGEILKSNKQQIKEQARNYLLYRYYGSILITFIAYTFSVLIECCNFNLLIFQFSQLANVFSILPVTFYIELL